MRAMIFAIDERLCRHPNYPRPEVCGCLFQGNTNIINIPMILETSNLGFQFPES